MLAFWVGMEKNGGMRGTPVRQLSMLSSLSTEDLIPADHPIRRIRVVVDTVLGELDGSFDAMYAKSGRPSVPPEMLLKASVSMAMYSMRSERAFCERLNYDMLFKWFLDLPIDAASLDASTFSKNRRRLLNQNIANEFFAAVVRRAKLHRYIPSDHFSVDGTLLEAWASHKSFKPKDSEPDSDAALKGRNAEVQWHGQKRSNDTHASTTDPDARLYHKSNNTAARLCCAGHLLIEHRSALIADAELTAATRYAERDCATEMLKRLPKSTRRAPWVAIRTTTRRTSSLTCAPPGSPRTSRRTPPPADLRSTSASPDTPDTTSANGQVENLGFGEVPVPPSSLGRADDRHRVRRLEPMHVLEEGLGGAGPLRRFHEKIEHTIAVDPRRNILQPDN